jgi:hypothetical protein
MKKIIILKFTLISTFTYSQSTMTIKNNTLCPYTIEFYTLDPTTCATNNSYTVIVSPELFFRGGILASTTIHTTLSGEQYYKAYFDITGSNNIIEGDTALPCVAFNGLTPLNTTTSSSCAGSVAFWGVFAPSTTNSNGDYDSFFEIW